MEVEQSATIGRPPSEVFAFAADLGNWTRWQPGTEDGPLPDGRMRVGTAFPQSFSVGGARMGLLCKVIRLKEGEEISLHYAREDAALVVAFLFAPDGGTDGAATRVTARGRGRLGGPYALFGPAVGREVNARTAASLGRLKASLEVPR